MGWSTDTTTGELSPWIRNYLLGYGGTKDDPSTPDVNEATPGYGGVLNYIQAIGNPNNSNLKYNTTAAENIASVQNRIAGFNPLQQQAFQNASNMQVNPFLQQGAGMVGMAGMGTYNLPTAQNYMNPYTQMVTNQQKQGAIQDYRRQLPALQATGYQQGAGRGTRSALLQSEANRNLQTKLGDIEYKGLQDAWTQGMGQYNTEQKNMMTAGTYLGDIGNSIYNQQVGINKLQQAAGASMQGQEQTALDTAYENYLAQQREPYQKLSFMLDALSGTPQGSSSSYYYAPAQRPDLASYKSGMILGGIGSLGKISGG